MDFAAFLRQVLPPLGLAPRPHHRRGLRRKLTRRLEALGLTGWEQYAARLEIDPAERGEFAALLGVTISRFWRNRAFWEHLAANVLPELCRGGLRAWSVGCASGEEPYSLAMLWRDVCPGQPLFLLATDIDREVLRRAEQGLYPPGSLRELPPGLKGRWFRPERGGLRLAAAIRGMVTLRRHDVLREPLPPEAKSFGLILCRNLAFTYFGEAARREVAGRLVSALAPGGYLAIGRKERLPEGEFGLAAAGYLGLFRRG